MLNDPVVIVGAARTPMGAFQGDFSTLSASELGAVAIRSAVERAGVAAGDVQEVIFGNVLPAGQGQAPARQASIGAGLPLATGCTTVNKMCGSAMKAAMLAHDLIVAGTNEIMVAGGMESMTNAPYLMPKARGGYRMGHQTVFDHMFLDGLEDAYDKGRLMGTFAEECATKYGFTREAQDAFALASLSRALAANNDGTFVWETAPVTIAGRKGETVIDRDEQPAKANRDRIPLLKPAFRKDGTVTAANSSSISDGAAALVLMRRSTAERRGLAPLAVIVGHATHAQEPGSVHDRAGGRDREALCSDRMVDARRRPVRDQRGVRRRDDGGDEGARHRPREGQRPRRRLRAGPPHRRIGRADPRDADRRAAQARTEEAASRRSASAAAKRPRWPSNSADTPGFSRARPIRRADRTPRCPASTISCCSSPPACCSCSRRGRTSCIWSRGRCARAATAGLVSLVGTTTGFVVHILAAALGLSAVFVAVPMLYDGVRWAGAAYLLYLAWDSVRPGSGGVFAPRKLPDAAPATLFRMGLLTSILNPKIALFYLALFPQFVDPSRGSVLGQSLVLGATQIVVAVVGDTMFVLAAAGVARWIATRPGWATAQRWVLAGVFAGDRREARSGRSPMNAPRPRLRRAGDRRVSAGFAAPPGRTPSTMPAA